MTSAPEIADAFITKTGVSEYWFNESNRSFFLRNDAGCWIDLSEVAFRRHLKKIERLHDKPKPGQLISLLDERISEIEKNHRIAYAGPLAGWRAGMHKVSGNRILITEDPELIEPKEGEWPVLEKFFEGLFCGEEPADEKGGVVKIDQRPWVFGQIRHAYECLRDGRTSGGLAMGIAGDPNCGKSFFALVYRWVLGGREARPYRAMIGEDAFNQDLATAVLWLVDDENQADTSLVKRQHFAGEIKMCVAGNAFRLRAMHRNPITLEILRRLLILCNLQGTRVLIFPPLEGDIDDKISLFKGYVRPRPAQPITLELPAEDACWPAPMPTRTEVEKQAYRDAVRAELPAFLWWLLNKFEMPSIVSGGRFVVRHYHHPAIVAALAEHSPALRLWELIVRSEVVFSHYSPGDDEHAASREPRTEWIGTACELEQLLKNGDGCRLSVDERREVRAANWLGRTLELCARHFGEAHCVQLPGRAHGRRWRLRPRGEDSRAEVTT